LGGVHIPSDVGPDGHSDADVVLHAVADAILGAAGLRDIGHYFPNTDAAIKGLDSAVIVKKAVAEAKAIVGSSAISTS
jgi:2-C-methyl-D-erythritol 4-phosphate cytidylyltransferase/2-C-methyl-D-erythritol 2,4-cyclodiphosphate synthase